MTDTWTTTVTKDTWESSTTPGVTFEVVIADPDAGTGDGTTMPSGTAGQVPQVQTGSTYELVTPNTANGLVRLDGSATIPDILHPSSIARDSEVTAAVATRQRIGTAPVVVANGGTIPAGSTLVLLQGSTATLPAASSHGLGQEMVLTCIGGVDCVLSATGSDLLGSGAGLTLDKDYTTKIAAADISALAGPGAINWGLTGTAFETADVTAILADYPTESELTTTLASYVTSSSLTTTLADYATESAVDAADAALGDATDLGDQRLAHADELAAAITNVFRCDELATGRWSTPNLTTEFTTGISVRTLMIPRRPAALPWFAETFTQPHDTGLGSWDNFEQAVLWPDDSFFDVSSSPSRQLLEGRPELFWEQTESGGSVDGSNWYARCLLADGQPVEVMTDITFGTGVGRQWLRVPYALDDGGTYHVDADDGAIFRLMSTLTSEKFESIDAHTEEWWLGNNFAGDIVRCIVRDGLDGTLIADPDATLVTPGASSFTDGAGNTWTGGAAAEVVELNPTERSVVGGQDEGPVVTATSATTLLDAAIPLTGEAGDHFTVSLGGTWLNNSGTTKTFTITVVIGSTTVATLAPVSAISSSASPRYWRGVVDIRVNGATDINVIADGQVSTSFFPVSGGTSTENIGAGANLDVRGAVQSGGSQELQVTQITVARARA